MTDTVIRHVPGKGRGVFAARPFAKGEVVEVCETIALRRPRKGSTLDHYVFIDGPVCRLALGNGSLYNHASRPNVEYLVGPLILFAAKRDIPAGKGLTIHYGPELWFDPK